MRVLLYGAIDSGSSNYGDFLYAKIVYDFLTEQSAIDSKNIFFYQPSSYLRQYIDFSRNFSLKGSVSDCDVGLYIPGGYFGEGHNASWKETLVQIKRFIPFGLKCMILKKPFAIIGVGAGPLNNILFRSFVKMIVRHAIMVTVRDRESLDSLKNIGCNNIISCSDAIIGIDLHKYDCIGCSCSYVGNALHKMSKKGLLVHFNHSKMAALKFGDAVKSFIKENKDYYPVVSSDQYLTGEDEVVSIFEQAYGSKNYIKYKYDNPYEFGSLITAMDFVLTSKLHVGVTAISKGKPTLAVAVHPEKTIRFYKQIDAEQNFLYLEKTNVYDIVDAMNKLKDSKIVIPKETILSAKDNMKQLEIFINNYK